MNTMGYAKLFLMARGRGGENADEDLVALTKLLDFYAKNSYQQGVVDGMERYSWWKDGVQYVGTCGKTLDEAVKEFLNA